MRRPWNGAMPVTLTLPLGLERRPRVRRRRLRRLAWGALLALGAVLLAAGFWLPAKAELAGHRETHFRRLGTLAIGDSLTLERPDGRVLTYQVADLEVVDSSRAELLLDADESVVVLVTGYPFETVTPGSNLRYVVTARQRF